MEKIFKLLFRLFKFIKKIICGIDYKALKKFLSVTVNRDVCCIE